MLFKAGVKYHRHISFIKLRKLPETLADGERFAMNESCLYFPCLHKRRESLTEHEDRKSEP